MFLFSLLKVNFKIHDVATWLTSSYNTHIAQGKQTLKFCQVIEHNKRNVVLQKSCRKSGKETISKPLSVKTYEVRASGLQLRPLFAESSVIVQHVPC